MKIVFMGTPTFSKEILESLVEGGHEITAVYTQPDKPQKRSSELIASPVKEYALSKGLKVYQPTKIKTAESVEELKKIPADVYVVAAYGQIISQEILDIPKYGCINVHGSLLPKYRGASPIQRAIADGEEKTGVTIMQMDKGIDTGDMLLKAEFAITDEDNEDTIYEKMAVEGSKALAVVLKQVEEGTVVRTPQDDSLSSYAPMLTKEEGKLDFNETARSLDCKVRGFLKWPTAYTGFNGKSLKVFKAKAVYNVEGEDIKAAPGTLLVTKKNLYVKAKDGYLELLEVQIEGKKRMPATDFARGLHLQSGDVLNL